MSKEEIDEPGSTPENDVPNAEIPSVVLPGGTIRPLRELTYEEMHPDAHVDGGF